MKKYFFKNLKKGVAFCRMRDIIKHVAEVQRRGEREYADVAELADALDSGSSGSDTVGVQVPSSAPKIPNAKVFGIFTYSLFIIHSSLFTNFYRPLEIFESETNLPFISLTQKPAQSRAFLCSYLFLQMLPSNEANFHTITDAAPDRLATSLL